MSISAGTGGSAVSTAGDMFVTGHIYDLYERGIVHAESCPCVNFKLPARTDS